MWEDAILKEGLHGCRMWGGSVRGDDARAQQPAGHPRNSRPAPGADTIEEMRFVSLACGGRSVERVRRREPPFLESEYCSIRSPIGPPLNKNICVNKIKNDQF